MESMLNEQEKQRAIEKFEKKQARLFPIGKGIVYAIVGWDIYTVMSLLLIVFFLVPGLDWLNTTDIMESTKDVGNVLVRGTTWAQCIHALLEITSINGLFSHLIYELTLDLSHEMRWHIYEMVNYLVPGVLCCLAGGLLITSDIALLRGKTWGRVVRGLFAILCIIGTVGRVLLSSGSFFLSVLLLVIELASCYLLFFSKAIKEYTYIKGQQF